MPPNSRNNAWRCWIILIRKGIVITKHGKPVARLIPADSACQDLIGSMKAKIQIHGDILSDRFRVGCSILIPTS